MSNATGEMQWLHLPVILHEGCSFSNICQVHFDFADVWQSGQLADDVVYHQLHEAQRLEVVGARGEDLVQPRQVLFESRFHIAHRTCHLKNNEIYTGMRLKGRKQEI